jgi:hemerythrin superfamily protein
MSAIDKLKSDHREVEGLFREIAEAEGPEEKRALFEELADKLAVHSAIEENHFYPAAKSRETANQLLEAVEEHLSVKRLISDLLRTDAEDEAFEAKLAVLQEQVDHHVTEEEDILFPKVERLLDATALNELEQEMMAMEEALLEEGDPRNQIPDETGAAAQL